MDLHTLRTVVHYSLHFLAPFLLALLFFPDGKRRKAYLIMFVTMLVDLDHLLATPVFSPHRMSIGFHPLHSYPAIVLYALMCCLPYGRHRYLPWWGRAIAIGLLFHMFTDWQDYVWWPHLHAFPPQMLFSPPCAAFFHAKAVQCALKTPLFFPETSLVSRKSSGVFV